jgi:ubiquinone biosynthesis UbiH/UbiF/VisC/COQ6 family hydroxylase
MKRYDIVISGGGMVGAITAVAASQAGLSVLLIEAQESPQLNSESPRDLRVSAISSNNIDYLKQLGIFDQLIQSRIQAYKHMQVWDNRSTGKIEFETDYSQQQCLGYLTENKNLVQAAWKKLVHGSTVTIQDNCTIKEFENNDSHVRIELSNGEHCKTRLLIAAEGRNSSVREAIGIKTTEKPYHQNGLVANITIPQAQKETAFQAFNSGGPIGILPIDSQQNLFSIVWSLPTAESNHWLNCDKSSFETELKSVIGQTDWQIELVSQRAAFPLTQLYANAFFNKRTVLCGDTAHGVHPLAGQGVNLGIGDIKQLFEVLDINTLKDNDLLHTALRKYQRRRISQAKETSEMMTFLHELFKDDKFIKKPIRNLGLNLINNLPFKKWLIGQAGS